jgi:hypothetical protein
MIIKDWKPKQSLKDIQDRKSIKCQWKFVLKL